MRAVTGCLAYLAATVPLACAAPQPAPRPIYLLSFYELDRVPIWRSSDSSPWYVVENADWADPRLIKWGYVPVTHDSKRYYCLIDNSPPTGSRIPEQTFVCGDPATAEWLFNNNYPPTRLLYVTP
jgi:hypothetical protein